ncbi:hypothetical protein ACHAQA_007363 [Verticillium albo-atrum]
MNSSKKRPAGSKTQPTPSKNAKSGQKTIDTFFSPRPQGTTQNTTPKKMRPSFQSTNAEPQTPSSSRFEIVIGSSTSAQKLTTATDNTQLHASITNISDLSPQFRRLAAQAAQPVSLSKPGSPADVKVFKSPATKRGSAAATAAGSGAEGTPSTAQKRKPGRPKGYRPSLGRIVSEAEAAALGARKIRTPKVINYYAGPRRRGRPAKPEEPKPRDVYETLAPRFVRFVCEWAGCCAELHNFETLRRHVRVVHARTRPGTCQWARCRDAGREFTTALELGEHLEEVHMPPIVWQAGDGPVITVKRYVVDDGTGALPAFLFDKTGSQVTPSIRDQKPEDLLTYRANRRKLKTLLLLRDQNMASDPESGDDGEDESPAA